MLRPVRFAPQIAPLAAPSGAAGSGFCDHTPPFDGQWIAPATQAWPRTGLDFTRQDYLALAAHPAIRAAALSALGEAHPSACAAAVTELETRLAAFLSLPRAFAFASGTEAIRATLFGLLRPDDDVLVDSGAHPAMAETVLAARARLHRSPAAQFDAMERRLARLWRQRRPGRIFIAVPAISAQGSQMADLAELTALARRYGACLIADVSHDLGALGQDGRGVQELQGCLGRIDVLVGSLARSFAAPGGFAALRDPSALDPRRPGAPHLARPNTVQARVILTALDLLDSAEGRRRRRRLHGCALRLRNHLMADGLKVMGQASPFVPVRLPMQTAQARTDLLQSAGPRVSLVQSPTVARHAPRWHIQLCADHGAADIDDLAELIRDVSRVFDRQSRRPTAPMQLVPE
jgi:7-keto-8-aminopelargonate synthetase-like enzyme